MNLGRLGRWTSGALLLPWLLALGACSDRKPAADQRSVEDNVADSEVVVPPPMPIPRVAPAVVPRETPHTPPPAEAPSHEAQIQDDAAASGMTSPIPDIAENAEPVGAENAH